MAEKYYSWSGYNYVMGNPVRLVDPDGRDTTILVLDQDARPQDNGVAGTSYTAQIYIFDDETGAFYGPYRGSSYPNSKSNSDNSTDYNTLKAGRYLYNNKFGHKGGTKKGLNLVNDEGMREVSGEDPNGNEVTMKYVNVHVGASDKGNARSRGSHGCITICPDDADTFFQHFDWSLNDRATKGNSTGEIIVHRGTEVENNSIVSAYRQTALAIQRERLIDDLLHFVKSLSVQ